MATEFRPHAAARIVPVKLTEDNYLLWKSMVVPVLLQYDMYDVVQGTVQHPPHPQREQNCMNFIKLTLSSAMLCHTVGCSTGRALWLKLEAQGEVVKSRLDQMRSQLQTLKKGTFMSMPDYYHSAKKIADRLAKAGSPVSDGDLVKDVLKGLPDDYAAFVNLIRARSDAVSMEELYYLLVEEEANRKRKLFRKVMKYGIAVLASFTVGYGYYLMTPLRKLKNRAAKPCKIHI